MCGIIGHVVATGRVADREAVLAGMNKLHHRGPDGNGVVSYDHACLGHTRLSIIDIERSIQPWCSEDGRYALVFNGEIYNYLELRKDLEKRGQRFISNGDTEVLMTMFILHGERCLEKLNGMFAFAVWDEVDRTLFIARDRLGKKPVYYSLFDGGVAFASEITALLEFKRLNTAIDLEAAEEFFAYQFINGSKSIHQGIRKLLPGHYLVYKGERPNIQQYWSPPYPAISANRDSGLTEQLVDLIDDAVRLRLRSDVPLGAFLSGGIDSAIIVATMRKLGADIETFTVGFTEQSFDERVESAEIARLFSTRHHAESLEISLPTIIDRYLTALGEPYADPSALPTWYLCEYARRYVTVALSGDGGDELFAGYRRYQARQWIGMLSMLPSRLRRLLIYRFANLLPDTDVYYGASFSKKLKLLLHMLQRFEESPTDLLPQTFTVTERSRLFTDETVEIRGTNHIKAFGLDGLDAISQMTLTDIQTYLSEDILSKIDRMSMAHSLEVRSPLLDYRIVEFACRLPASLKIKQRQQKYILREAYKQQLPTNVLRRPKHGFAVPVSQWLRRELKSLFELVVLDTPCPTFLRRKEIDGLWKDHQQGRGDNGMKLWSILMFFGWFDRQARQ